MFLSSRKTIELNGGPFQAATFDDTVSGDHGELSSVSRKDAAAEWSQAMEAELQKALLSSFFGPDLSASK